jgi:hypothetical protein
MADEVASIRDALTSETTEAKTVETAAAETKDVPRIVEALDPEAVEIGRILHASGVTKDQVNDLLQAPRALEAMRSALQGNPDEFFNMLQRTDPKTEEKLLQAGADRFVKRYADDTKPDGKGKPDANSDLMREVGALREQLNTFRTKDEQREQRSAMAATRQRYDARVDDLFGLDGVKALGLTKSEQKSMRAQLDVELAKDPSVVQRASNGNFVDVPQVFQGIVEDWAKDRKEAAEVAAGTRKRSQSGAFSEFSSGANPFMDIDLPAGSSDSWDATETAMANALQRTAR